MQKLLINNSLLRVVDDGTLQDDIVLPCRLSPLVHVTNTTSDHIARRYCPTLSIISPCTCDKHNIWPHYKTILSYLVDYLPLYMWQPQHLTTMQDDIVLPCGLSPLVHVTNTTSDHTARRCCPTLSIISPCTCDNHNIWPQCKTILSYLVEYLPLYMWQHNIWPHSLQDDIVLPCRLSPLVHVTNTTSDHIARRYCPTLSIISPCTCDKHNIWPHCKTILSYFIDYLPLYMWQPQHLTKLQDDIVLPCRLSPLVHVTNTTSDYIARRYCPTLSIISPCTCDKHNIWPHCKTILSYLVDYLPLYMWQTQHLTTLQDDIVLPCRLSPLVHVTNTTSDHTARRYCPTLSIISPCTCDNHNIWPQCKTILSYLVDYLPLYMWQTQHLTSLQDDIVLPCRLSPLVHVTTTTSDHNARRYCPTLSSISPCTCDNTTSDHNARRYCPTLSIISPCTCDKHNIWPHCKTILSYLVDYLPLYMWQTQHLTTLQDDIVLLYRLSPLVHVTTTTSDHIARRYCPTLSIISPCTCDKHNIWLHCKTILPYLVDYLPLYMWQTQHLTTLQDDIVLPCRLSSLVHVTNTTSDHIARRYCPTLSIISPCTCDEHNIWPHSLQDDIVLPCRLSPLVHVRNNIWPHSLQDDIVLPCRLSPLVHVRNNIWPHCKTILFYLVVYLPLYMWQPQHLTTMQDDIVLPCRLSPLVHVTNTTSDHTARRYCLTLSIISPYTCDKHNIWPHCKTILSYFIDYLPLYMWQPQHLTTLQDDIVLPCRLSPLVHVTTTTSDHTARRYCPTLSIISPCTCDKHNIWPHCKTTLPYLVDYIPLYMWQTQHLTTLEDDIVLPCRLSSLVHVTNTTSDPITRWYCPTLSIISPCTCDKHNIWPHCKTILSYLVDYLPLYMWQTQHLTTLQDDIVLPCRLSPLVHVTNTTSDHIARRYCSTLSIISPCTCDKHNIWPHCKTILSYLVDYLPLYMWQTQHLTHSLQDDIVLPCRLSPLVHVINTTSDHTVRRYCSTLSIISPVHSLVRSSYTIQIFRIEKIAGVNSWKFYIRCSNVKLTIVV